MEKTLKLKKKFDTCLVLLKMTKIDINNIKPSK